MDRDKQVSLWMSQSMATELSDRAWERRLSVTEFIRRAIKTALDKCREGGK